MNAAPAEEAGVAEAILAAATAREPLLVQGRGTKLGMLRSLDVGRLV